MKTELVKKREAIALLGGYKIITNYPPNVWSNGKNKITNISFDKPKMYKELMDIVSKLEIENDLIIEIKRFQCNIKQMYFTSNRTFISVDGVDSKQKAIFLALSCLMIDKGKIKIQETTF